MRPGFTLLEVVVALLVLEVAVFAAVGTLALASSTVGRAETLELAVAAAEGVLDSLSAGLTPGEGERVFRGGVVRWTGSGDGTLSVAAMDMAGDTLLVLHSMAPVR